MCLTREYRVALEGYRDYAPAGAVVRELGGNHGERLTQLYAWLHGTEAQGR